MQAVCEQIDVLLGACKLNQQTSWTLQHPGLSKEPCRPVMWPCIECAAVQAVCEQIDVLLGASTSQDTLRKPSSFLA